jgi:hypothetical protein
MVNIVAVSKLADTRKDVLAFKENYYKDALKVVCVPFWQNHMLEGNYKLIANNQKNKFKLVHSEGKRN